MSYYELTGVRRLWAWLVCSVWHSDYSTRLVSYVHRYECTECGREWSE